MSAISLEAAFIFSQVSFARTAFCSAIPLKMLGIAKSGMSKPSFGFDRLAFTSTSRLVSFTGFVLSSATEITTVRFASRRRRTACRAVERRTSPKLPPCSGAVVDNPRTRLDRICLTSGGPSVRFLTLTSDFFASHMSRTKRLAQPLIR